MNYMNKDGGEAYGFFYSDASEEKIIAEFPTIRRLENTPDSLELYLTKDMAGIEGDKELTDLAQEAKQDGANYMLQATNPEGTNESTAREVTAIFNQLYNTRLYEKNEEFRGGVVYKENGKYAFMD